MQQSLFVCYVIYYQIITKPLICTDYIEQNAMMGIQYVQNKFYLHRLSGMFFYKYGCNFYLKLVFVEKSSAVRNNILYGDSKVVHKLLVFFLSAFT